MSKSDVLIRKVGRINWSNSRPQRAGIILYDANGMYLGVDSYTKELTDFGGEINYVNEDTISGSLREYREETLDTFPSLTWFDIFSSYAVLADSIVIFLIKVNQDLNPFIENFHIKKGKRKVELSDILYVSWDEIGEFQIYKKIKQLISFVVDRRDWE